MNIKVNDNLLMIFQFINECLSPVGYNELIQYCIDFDLYKEFYTHNHIINKLYDWKMQDLTKNVVIKKTLK